MNKKNLILGVGLLTITFILGACNKTSFTSRDVDFYYSTSTSKDKMKLYFSDEHQGIPYIEVTEIPDIFKNLFSSPHDQMEYTLSQSGNSYQIKRENGSYIEFDFKANTFYSNNRTKFEQRSIMPYGLMVDSIDNHFYDDEGNAIDNQINLIDRRSTGVEASADPIYIDFDTYDIQLITSGDNHLIPFTTINDLVGASSVAISYNGHDLFLTGSTLDTSVKESNGKTIADLYYEHVNDSRSDALIKYNYNELCLNLDTSYGLKESHGISTFDAFFKSYGMKDMLLSHDKREANKAYVMMQVSNLADNHTGFDCQMPYEGYIEDAVHVASAEVPIDAGYRVKATNDEIITRARLKYNNLASTGAVVNPYLEVGDTAIITFDHFVMQSDTSIYYTDEFKNNKEQYISSDTIALVSYAQDRITSNSNIKRVIVDISGNGGGMADSAVFVLAWLDSGIVNIKNPIDGGRSSIEYRADVNLDKKIDDTDYLDSYVSNVYCLISGKSFSCGNLVPCMLKESKRVKLVGEQSGGGACVVKICGFADGTIFQCSSNKLLCFSSNGSFYDIDQGVAPDYYLKNFETLYGGTTVEGVDSGDRVNIVNYIKKIEGID